MTGLVLRDVELPSGRRADVRIEAGRVVDVAPRVDRHAGETEFFGGGGALFPGLHDHHVHLLATAAARGSVRCGPPTVNNARDLAAALHTAPTGSDGWVRGVGYHEQVAGDLDRHVLDALGPDRPIRVQHRSGALWVLNSAGLAAVDAAAGPHPPGLEHDADGRPTGRLFRADRWLRDRIGPHPPPDLGALGATLLRAGVTGVTDATPDLNAATRSLLVEATADGRLPQRLCLLGADETPGREARGRVLVGPRKLVLADHDLPDLPTLCGWIRDARDTRPDGARPVAVHCVTRVALVLLVAAWDDVGAVPGDRIEHAAVVPDDLVPALVRHGVTVVTQPGLVAERGDDYLADVDADDLLGLYRVASLRAAGVPVVLSTDAPYASVDPWATVRAAVNRTTPSGAVVGADERVDARTALDMLAAPLLAPGAGAPRLVPGVPAELVLARVPWDFLEVNPRRELIRATIVGDTLISHQLSQ